LLMALVVGCGDGEAATQKQYEAVASGVRHAIDGIRHQLPKRVDELTTLTNVYIDPNDDRKAVFVSALYVSESEIDQKNWLDLRRKLHN